MRCKRHTYRCRSWACGRRGSRTAQGWERRWCRSAAGHCFRWSCGPSQRPCARGEPDTCGARHQRTALPTGSPARRSADVYRWMPQTRKETAGTAPNQTDDSRTARDCRGDLHKEQMLPSVTKTLQLNWNGLNTETNSPSIILESSASWGGFGENHEARTSAGTVVRLLLDRSR